MKDNELYIPRGYFHSEKMRELVPNGAVARWREMRSLACKMVPADDAPEEVLNVPEFLIEKRFGY